MKILICFFATAILFKQKCLSFTYHEWHSQLEMASGDPLKDIQTQTDGRSTELNNKKIEFFRQTINGKPILNSFIKKISKNSRPELTQALLVEKNSLINIKKQENKNFEAAVLLKKITPPLGHIEIINSEEAYVMEGSQAQNRFVVSFFDKSGTPYEAYFNTSGDFIKFERVGSQFSDISATVFTDGPKLSQISEQIINNISASPSLSNDMIFVSSESKTKIESISPILKFDIKDDRFDQLQVFYYLNKSFSWMKENLNFNVPARVDVVTYMGYPEKTNSSFYYQNKIRFGKGDDIIYSNIAQDPSIVYHESFHVLIDNVAHLPFQGEGGSINEGMADFFTCLMLNRPYLAESSYLKADFKRNLNLLTKLDEKNGGLYHDSAIVSGLFWELKDKIGEKITKNLALETLILLNPATDFSEFNKKLIEVSKKILTVDQLKNLQLVLKTRGFIYE
jgi:hypothetical protein